MKASQSILAPGTPWVDDVERYEVIDGIRVEREPMGAFETVLASWLCYLLNSFAAGKKLGLAVHETLFVLNASRNLPLSVTDASQYSGTYRHPGRRRGTARFSATHCPIVRSRDQTRISRLAAARSHRRASPPVELSAVRTYTPTGSSVLTTPFV